LPCVFLCSHSWHLMQRGSCRGSAWKKSRPRPLRLATSPRRWRSPAVPELFLLQWSSRSSSAAAGSGCSCTESGGLVIYGHALRNTPLGPAPGPLRHRFRLCPSEGARLVLGRRQNGKQVGARKHPWHRSSRARRRNRRRAVPSKSMAPPPGDSCRPGPRLRRRVQGVPAKPCRRSHQLADRGITVVCNRSRGVRAAPSSREAVPELAIVEPLSARLRGIERDVVLLDSGRKRLCQARCGTQMTGSFDETKQPPKSEAINRPRCSTSSGRSPHRPVAP
jgi:hypothetical protein